MERRARAAALDVRWRSSWVRLTADRISPASLLLGEQRGIQVLRRVSGWWGLAIGLMTVGLGGLLHARPLPGAHPTVILVIGLVSTALGLTYLALGDRSGERSLNALSLGALVGMVVSTGLVGPHLEVAMCVAALGCTQALFYLRKRVALVGALLVVVSYAVLLSIRPGYPNPAARLLVFVVTLGATSIVLAWIVSEIEKLSAREHEAQADLAATTAALAEANSLLEERVGLQGEEIGSLQRLRQFVSPQVAQALLDHGIEALAPHRCRIAVVFCDLRGFTAFSSSAEPEDVMEVLHEYYAVVGRALQDAGATVGSFAGDGIMAYFGDPVPAVDPAAIAVRMSLELNDEMRQVVRAWQRRGFQVGCAFGLAYGFATVGPVGFDGRTDYTALGPTVNLASRLCDLAADGELLVDSRACAAVEGRVAEEEVVLDVPGFPVAVHAHRVTRWLGDDEAPGEEAGAPGVPVQADGAPHLRSAAG